MQSSTSNKTNINLSSENDFVEFHKKKRSYWLLISLFILFVALATFIYAFQTQSQYKKMTVDTDRKEGIKLSENQSDSETNIRMTEDVKNTKLFFQNERQIFRKSPLDAPPEEVLLADTYAVSADGNKIAFYRGEMADNNGYFAVLDLTTKKETEHKLKEYETLRGLEWSPDDKFILINYGTSMYGSTKVFDLDKKSESGFFGQHGNNIWLNNETLYVAQMAKNINNRFVESGSGSNVVEISLKNPMIPKVVVAADLRHDYFPVSMTGDCLVLRIDSVENEKDWESLDRDSKVKKDFGCYNTKTGDKSITKIEYNDSDNDLLIEEIKKELQIDEDKLVYVQIISSNFESNYKIAYVNKGGSIYGSDIFLIDPNDVSGSIFLLGQGAEIFWIKM